MKRSRLTTIMLFSIILSSCGGTPRQVTIHGALTRVDLNGMRGCDADAVEWLNWYLGGRSVTVYGPDTDRAIASAATPATVDVTPKGTGCWGSASFTLTVPSEDLYQVTAHMSSGDQNFSISLNDLKQRDFEWEMNVS